MPQYEFWVQPATGVWRQLRALAGEASCVWGPTVGSEHAFPVRVSEAATRAEAVGLSEPGGVSVTPFRGDRRAAVTYSFDDGLLSQTDVIAPLFTRHGMRATFYINPEWVLEENDFTDPGLPGDWQGWRRVLTDGHEVGNHSLSHLRLTPLTPAELDREVNASSKLLHQHLGVAPLTFACPYNAWNARVLAMTAQRHLWTRGQCFPLESSTFTLAGANATITDAIARGTWIVFCGHGVDGAGWEPIGSTALAQHLAFVQTRTGDIWVDTAANVARYVAERAAAQIQLLEIGPQSRRFIVDCPGLARARYTTPLTLKVAVGATQLTGATALQGKTPLPVTLVPGALLVEAAPGPQPITVTYW